MTTVTVQDITNANCYRLSKKSESDVAIINSALAALESAISEMKKLNDTVSHFIWDNADDVGFMVIQPEHSKMQQMILMSPSENPNGLEMRHWVGDKYPVSNWIAHTKNIRKHIRLLQVEYDTHKKNGRVVSWWVD